MEGMKKNSSEESKKNNGGKLKKKWSDKGATCRVFVCHKT
jgi:hypothetical protein